LIQSETYQVHIPEGGTEVQHEKFTLRVVSSCLPDAQSLHVVGVLLLHGQAVLAAHAGEDVRLGLVDVLCKKTPTLHW